jgi:hypothetical protein
MGKVKNTKKKQARHNATGMQTNAEIAEAESLQTVPMETILPLIAKVCLANSTLFFFILFTLVINGGSNLQLT